MAVDPLTHSSYPAKSEFNLLTSRETILTARNARLYTLLYTTSQIQSLSKTPRRAYSDGTEKLHDNPSPSPNHGPAGDTAAQLQRVDSNISLQFKTIDTDRSGSITATELMNVLGEGFPRTLLHTFACGMGLVAETRCVAFEIDTVKLLMSIFDTNRNGTIDADEFDGLRKYIEVCPSPSRIGDLTVRAQSWERVFQRFDTNNSNTIDGDELQQALKELGYELSPPLQDLLKRKYDVNWDYEEAAAGAGPAAAPPAGPAVAPPTGAAAGTIPSSGITFDRFMRACVVVKQLKESFEALDRDSYGRVKIDYDTFLRMVFKLP
ncbi:hypothetical protein BGY98DRAFT_1099985 [Russula aff. rugulosa BPL654]|nr:hypothetical protein BGY98DRAFT_1099985 [Russula aff. rugulosa BPL654]